LKTRLSTNLHTYRACPICNSSQISEVVKAVDYTVSRETFSVWHCRDCSTRFTQDIPIEEEIGQYYKAEEYVSHTNTSKGLINFLYQRVKRYTLVQKRNLVQRESGVKRSNVLDIGCGTGDFLGAMTKIGWRVYGLEPDDGARRLAKENHGLEIQENKGLFSFADDMFMAVTMWHVLEHVHKLHDYLQTIKRVLRDNGTLFIAVPNYQSVDAEVYQGHWAAYDVPRHLYHFSPKGMETLLAHNGFEIHKKLIMPFDSFYVSLLSEKYKHGGTRLVSAFWNGLKSFLKARRNPDKSSSILYIVRKKV